MIRAPSLRDERGIALAIAVLALVVVGALITGVFFVARVEQLSSSNAAWTAQAQQTAEAGITSVMGASASTYSSLAVGASSVGSYAQLGTGPDWYQVTVTKVNADNKFLVTALGERRAANSSVVASRRIGLLARMATAAIQTGPAAITTLGDVNIGGNSDVNGNDVRPGNWTTTDCPNALSNAAGVRYNNGAVSVTGSGSLVGSPASQLDPTLNSSAFTNFGDYNVNDLISIANYTLPPNYNFNSVGPVVTSGQCDQTNTNNWGEPNHANASTAACQGYFPIIYITGNTTLQSNGRGQGVLIVNGNLDIRGGFQFYGVVIASGTVSTGNGTANVYGTVLAQNVSLADNNLLGNATVQYSSCAVTNALAGTGRLKGFTQRAWTQFYN